MLKINVYGDEILRQKAKIITKVDSKLIYLVDEMFKTMKASGGIGLAANQVGKRIQLLVVDVTEVEGYEKTKPMVVINPKIISSEGESEIEEGCLSLPEIRVNVKRPAKIKLKYKDLNLIEHVEEFDGLIARVLQHEIDHLNGRLIIDYLTKTEKEKIKPLLEKIKKREFEAKYSVSPLQV